MIISGKVVTGAHRGKKIGFPTANIKFSPFWKKSLAEKEISGVYAVYVYIEGKKHKGAANIGYAPTFGTRRKLLEVYIFNFSRNIVGKKIDVQLVKKLREEKKFTSASELVKQIRKDVKNAKLILK